MIFYKHEQQRPAPLVMGSRWDYSGPVFEKMPPFAKALTLSRVGSHNNTAIVRFRETGNANYSMAFFMSGHFTETKRTHEQSIADYLMTLDFREPKNAANLKSLQGYMAKLYNTEESFNIFTAVIRAQSFGTAHVTGLGEGDFEPVTVQMDEEYNFCLPSTNGDWEVIKSTIAEMRLPIHRLISEKEARRIATIYNGQELNSSETLYSAQRVKRLALREGDNMNFIPRTIGDFNLKLTFETEDVCDYVVTGTTLDEAQQICFETADRCQKLGVVFAYDIY